MVEGSDQEVLLFVAGFLCFIWAASYFSLHLLLSKEYSSAEEVASTDAQTQYPWDKIRALIFCTAPSRLSKSWVRRKIASFFLW